MRRLLHSNAPSAVYHHLLTIAVVAMFTIAATLAATGGASAQEDRQLDPQQPVIELAGFTADAPEQAQAVITVLGVDGLPVADLTASDVRVQVNDVFVPVEALDRAVDSTLPIAIVLALDVSGSMEGGALEEAKAAARLFLDDLGPGDSVAVVTFHDTVDPVVPFTQDHAAAAAAIDSVTASGATALYQATDESVRIAAATGHPYRAVILLSDGFDHGSALLREDVTATVGSLAVPVYTIGLGEEIDRAYLEDVAALSGGSFAATPSADGLAALYAAAGERLRGQYVLTLDTSLLGLTLSEPMHVQVHVTTESIQEIAERDVCAQQLCVAVSAEGDALAAEGSVTYVANVISSDAVSAVTYMLDGEPVAEVTAPPYTFVLSPSQLSDDEHDFVAVVTTVAGATESSALVIGTPPVEGSSGMLPLLLVAAGAAVLIALIAAFVYQRRRPRFGNERQLDPANLVPPSRGGPAVARKPAGPFDEEPAAEPVAVTDAMGRLVVSGGALTGQSFAVGSSPVSIGSASRCLIRLEDGSDGDQQVAPEHARVWVRDEQLMVHEMQRLTAYGPEGGRWQKLANGDSFSIGPYEIHFAVGGDAEIGFEVPNVEVPNVLRTPEPADESGSANGAPASAPSVNGGDSSGWSNGTAADAASDAARQAASPANETASAAGQAAPPTSDPPHEPGSSFRLVTERLDEDSAGPGSGISPGGGEL